MALLSCISRCNFQAFCFQAMLCLDLVFGKFLDHCNCILHHVKLGNAFRIFVFLKSCPRFLNSLEGNSWLFENDVIDVIYLIHIKAIV